MTTETPLRPAAASPADAGAPSSIDGAMLRGGTLVDRVYDSVITFFAMCVPVLLLLLFFEVAKAGWPAFSQFGFGFLFSSDWDPVNSKFGALPAIYGTIVSSILALLIATPLAIGVAIYIAEFAPPWLRRPVGFLVDLLAAIPSVVYGLWGIFVLVPVMRQYVMPFLRDTLHLGATPLFSGPAYGPSMLTAGVVLAIMVLPYISSVSREVLLAVPRSQREAALALGATRWEAITGAVLPFAKSGIIGGIILGLGRALGETMAVTMVIGNRHELATSLFAPGYTIASLIANEFAEASGDLHLSALMAVGFVLLMITFVVNGIARWLVWQTASQAKGKR
jgi:phosphate transport system permease protein